MSESTAPKFQMKQFVGVVIAVLLMLFFQFACPVPEGLERTAMSAVGILACCIVLWVTEAVPFIVTVVLIYFLIPITNVIPVADVYNAASLQVPIYCLFVFTVSGAVMATPIPMRIANLALKVAGNSPTKLVIAFTMATAFLSMFISDLAAAAIFIGIGLTIVEANGGIKGQSGLAKALTLAVGAAAAIGGIGTPLGNSLNMLSIAMVGQYMGVTVTFLNWCIICAPLAMVGAFLAALYITRVFKLEPINDDAIKVVSDKVAGFGKMSAHEIKVLVWFIIAFGLNMASTWVPAINSMLVCFLFTFIAYIPGVSLLTKEQFHKSIAWEIIMMIIGVSLVSSGLVSTGVATWFVNTVLAGATAWPFLVVIFVMCFITFILHIAIPVGPPCCSVAVPLLCALAALTGVNPAIIAAIGGIYGGVTTVLPIDSIQMICYERGWITMAEWVKKGWVSTFILVVVGTFYLPAITALLGY
ncbi:MAG TPA: anion permease [Candidatus Aphodovivens excrementavium]|nr:anion permease [Candidatus Aphodovivens excrementavium]